MVMMKRDLGELLVERQRNSAGEEDYYQQRLACGKSDYALRRDRLLAFPLEERRTSHAIAQALERGVCGVGVLWRILLLGGECVRIIAQAEDIEFLGQLFKLL